MAQFQEKIINIELENCIYEHTDSGPDGLVEHTFPDSVVPFDLKGLLDAKILQFLKLVEELVDRILTFYMITDPSIGCRDQLPPLLREIALKTYLKTPPVGNENRMAQWMNRIGELIEEMHPQVHNYVMIEGERSAVPQRRWTAGAVGKPLAASSSYNLRHKPDVALVNVIGDEIMSLTGQMGG